MGRCSRLADVWARVGRPGPTVSVRCGVGPTGWGYGELDSIGVCLSFVGRTGVRTRFWKFSFFFSAFFPSFIFGLFFLINGIMMVFFLCVKRWGFHVGAIMAVLFCDVGGTIGFPLGVVVLLVWV